MMLSRAAAVALVQEQQQEIAFPEPSLRVVGPVCAHCHEPFNGRRSDAVYCSDDCRIAAARKRGSI